MGVQHMLTGEGDLSATAPSLTRPLGERVRCPLRARGESEHDQRRSHALPRLTIRAPVAAPLVSPAAPPPPGEGEGKLMLALNDPTLARVFAPRTTIAPDGTVEGYASLFGEIDQARDMVMAGAFRQTLTLRGLRRIPMLFQHDPAEPIGIWLELVEDSRGLYARGRLIPDVQRGREVLALVKAGAIDGLSIGFKTVQGRVDPRTRIRKIEQVDLWEISIVTFPLLTGARVRAVKDAGATAHREGDRHERLFRRHPRVSFARYARRSGVEGDLPRRGGERGCGMRGACVARGTGRLQRAVRGSNACSNAAKRRRRGANAASAAGSPTARYARWPTARRCWRALRADLPFAPLTRLSRRAQTGNLDQCFRTSRNGSRTSASAGCGPTPSAGCGRTRSGG